MTIVTVVAIVTNAIGNTAQVTLNERSFISEAVRGGVKLSSCMEGSSDDGADDQRKSSGFEGCVLHLKVEAIECKQKIAKLMTPRRET
ncbi:hypothetical protein FisN_5Hu458 [Fistulifera solaris]|uniref:Uncharacterized protein n=1 Tax=Fistulifera solaris TaxID=1519565 RepID=A0A1Z5JSR3_FISSO|nr:hypothetical protein FisN_5Hu458 [Fistulifera solaris]|eukprot:GAX17073.1 hypothetical protein FisN_5Hu458 [Fistulifera solaris]